MMDRIDKQSFLDEYKLHDIYKESLISWDTIEEIINAYQRNMEIVMEPVRQKLENLLKKELFSKDFQGKVHSVESRLKEPLHLAEKIVRKICIEDSDKYKNINKDNYHDIVRDLIGIRILVLAKENWEEVHDKLCDIFPRETCKKGQSGYMVEKPRAYIRYGDRDVFGNKIKTDYTNKGYRSQHYIIYLEGLHCEIQVRTISEEVFGEFDHYVRYPYRTKNKFLVRYTNTVSQITSMVDELVSTCLQMRGDMWDQCAEFFEDDNYQTFEKSSKPVNVGQQNVSEMYLPKEADQLTRNKLMRKMNREKGN